MCNEKRFEFQLRLIEKGLDHLQSVIGRLDDILFKIKTSAITVWVALMGWSITVESKVIVLLGIPTLLGFWVIGSTFRAIQIRYIEKAQSYEEFLNKNKDLKEYFEDQKIPDGKVYSLSGDESRQRQIELLIKGIVSPTVAVFYGFFICINIVLWRHLSF